MKASHRKLNDGWAKAKIDKSANFPLGNEHLRVTIEMVEYPIQAVLLVFSIPWAAAQGYQGTTLVFGPRTGTATLRYLYWWYPKLHRPMEFISDHCCTIGHEARPATELEKRKGAFILATSNPDAKSRSYKTTMKKTLVTAEKEATLYFM